MKDSRIRLPLIIFTSVLVADQITKNIVLNYIDFGQSISVWGEWIRFTLVLNPGGAFSLRLVSPVYYLILSIVIFTILIWFIYYKREATYLSLPLSFVAGGAAGNIIDRLRFGEVVDFIDCEFFDINIGSYHLDRWPIFNIADAAISCGIIATIVLTFYLSAKSENEVEDISE